MKDLLLVAAGGAAGSVARWWLSLTVDARLAHIWSGFQWGTLLVNVIGCLAIGVLSVTVGKGTGWWNLLAIGVLGGFTTFSSFALQTFQMNSAGAQVQAMCYIAASVILCLVAVGLGVQLGRWLA